MSDRTSPAHWDAEQREFEKYAERPLRHLEQFSAWFRGDMTDIPMAAEPNSMGDTPALANMTHLATRVLRGDLYFRNPRFQVRPPSMNKLIFTPLLAQVETSLLDDWAEETNLYLQMRRGILDGCLGPYMVWKTTFGFDVGVDTVEIEKERIVAQMEDQKYLMLATKPVVKDTDCHEVHIEQHEGTIAACERGDITIPDKALEYLRKHVKMHQKAIPWSRPVETLRNQSVQTRRIHPKNYSFDPWPTDPSQRTWFRERYLARMEDVQANKNYSVKGKKGLSPAKVRLPQMQMRPGVRRSTELDTRDQNVVLFEVVDLVAQKVIVYAEGCETALEVRDWTLGSILPSGPYTDGTFCEDVDESFGIAIPYIYSAAQEALSMVEGVNIETVRRSPPKTIVDARYLDDKALEDITKFEVASIIKVRPPGQMKAADVISTGVAGEVPQQNIQAAQRLSRMIEVVTGLGSAKLGGGDFSRTATASDVSADARDSLAEDFRAVLDNISSNLAKKSLRLMRAFYTPARVYEIVGDQALLPGAWPKNGFAYRDIVADRGVTVVPGSSARNNSAIQAKQLQDMYVAVAPDPMIAPQFKIELLRRFAEAVGVFGLDYDSLIQFQAQMAGQAPTGEQGAEEPGASEMEEPSRAGMIQGQNNVGGGRVPTGAGAGDKERITRGGAGRGV